MKKNELMSCIAHFSPWIRNYPLKSWFLLEIHLEGKQDRQSLDISCGSLLLLKLVRFSEKRSERGWTSPSGPQLEG